MKKFIYKICLLLLLVILFDVVFGLVMGKISKDIDLGGVGRDNYICDKELMILLFLVLQGQNIIIILK